MKEEIIAGNKDNETYVSYEIKAIISLDKGNSWEYIKTNNKMIINDIEYNHMKKKLNDEYGIADHFEDLDNEVEKIINKGNKK